ncbi:MAG: hypothetical protein IRY83_12160 [Chloroflexi bacterium]|nr:hypothetical protein [Chloroflexota bacterium]
MPDERWRPVPLDDLTFDGTVNREDDPCPRVLCPCGARIIIDEPGPGQCCGCHRWYRSPAPGLVERWEVVRDEA